MKAGKPNEFKCVPTRVDVSSYCETLVSFQVMEVNDYPTLAGLSLFYQTHLPASKQTRKKQWKESDEHHSFRTVEKWLLPGLCCLSLAKGSPKAKDPNKPTCKNFSAANTL